MPDDDDILEEARQRFERCVTWETTARDRALRDMRFAEGDAYNQTQWDEDIRRVRVNRPCLTHNKVRQHNLMIVNDARQNKAQIKVTPTGDNATYEAAQVFAGIIRRIEYQSKAIDAYSTATWHQVQTGIGYCRVVTEYESGDSFNQELYIRRISDPRTVYLDPDAKDYDKADMKYAFVFVDIPRDEYEREHGKDDMPMQSPTGFDHHDANGFNNRDHVRIAEYWRRNEQKDKLHRLRNGETVREGRMLPHMRQAYRPHIVDTRDVTEHTVEWFKIVGDRVDDRGTWAGKYIPIVPCIGEETVIDGVMDRKGHTRSQIDAQRIYNYWASAAVEQVALQTKIPYIADVRAIGNFQPLWERANIENKAYLPYNGIGDDGQPIPPPQRTAPPEMSQAYVQGMMVSRQDLLDVTGQYQAELGMPSNERSGVAIQQRQRQGDTATYHYIDNQAKMIRQIGRILLDLIPKIYDVPRVIKIMGDDGSEEDVLSVPGRGVPHQQVTMGPEGPQPLDQQQQAQIERGQKLKNIISIFDPSTGRYDVEADVGPSYGTQRQEAANAFSQIMANNPAAFQIVGDFWARNSDFPGADELADRLQRGLPPQYGSGPSPQEQQLQQQLQVTQQHAQQVLQQADAHVARLQGEVTRHKELQDAKIAELTIDDYKAETDRLKALGQIDPAAMQIIVRQLLRDMVATDIVPLLRQHAALEGDLQTSMQPTPPPQPAGANGGNGNGAGAQAA